MVEDQPRWLNFQKGNIDYLESQKITSMQLLHHQEKYQQSSQKKEFPLKLDQV